jgi:hypothetical protein
MSKKSIYIVFTSHLKIGANNAEDLMSKFVMTDADKITFLQFEAMKVIEKTSRIEAELAYQR